MYHNLGMRWGKAEFHPQTMVTGPISGETLAVVLTMESGSKTFKIYFILLISCRLDRFKGSPRFVNFGECLADTVEQQWDTVLAATAHPRTNAGFLLYINEFYQRYVQEDAKDVMIEYMATEECIQSRNAATLDHCNRMQIMMRRMNRLPGIEPYTGDNKSKQLIFRSMLDKYKRSYLESGHVVADETLVSVVRYMEQQENVDA